MISYIKHPETAETKKHTDILYNGQYIGYYINKSKCAFIEWDREIYTAEFKNTRQLERIINRLINE